MTSVHSTVRDIAASYSAAPAILFEKGFDFCCGGQESFEEACALKKVSPGQLLQQIQAASVDSEVEPASMWQDKPLTDLIQYILKTFHEPLYEIMPGLEKMAIKVASVHKDKDAERLSALLQTFSGLKAELQSHMAKEEQILFPWIESGRGASAGPPIRVMTMEHESAKVALERLRELTRDYQTPAWACGTVKALWEGLRKFDLDLRQHMHLETHILFPRALQS